LTMYQITLNLANQSLVSSGASASKILEKELANMRKEIKTLIDEAEDSRNAAFNAGAAYRDVSTLVTLSRIIKGFNVKASEAFGTMIAVFDGFSAYLLETNQMNLREDVVKLRDKLYLRLQDGS
jgi:hypothetical protein